MEFHTREELERHYKAVRRKFFPPTRPIAYIPREPERPLTPIEESGAVENRLAELGDWPTLLARYQANRKRLSWRRIALLTAARHNITYAELMGPSQEHKYVRARHEAIILVCTAFPLATLSAIGRMFGRDHSSIANALKKKVRRTK